MKTIACLTFICLTLKCFAQDATVTALHRTVDTSWLRANPEFESTRPSFFNKTNAEEYYIAPLRFSGYGVPFTWDSDLSMLDFLTKDSHYTRLEGKMADSIYLGTKLIWNEPSPALLWVNERSYESFVEDWHLMGLNDCPGTIMLPSGSFKRAFEVSNAITNNLKGLVIIPYTNSFKNIRSAPLSLTTTDGLIRDGVGYDLNGDHIHDLFFFEDELVEHDASNTYQRLYVNIDGKWIYKRTTFYQECI